MLDVLRLDKKSRCAHETVPWGGPWAPGTSQGSPGDRLKPPGDPPRDPPGIPQGALGNPRDPQGTPWVSLGILLGFHRTPKDPRGPSYHVYFENGGFFGWPYVYIKKRKKHIWHIPLSCSFVFNLAGIRGLKPSSFCQECLHAAPSARNARSGGS